MPGWFVFALALTYLVFLFLVASYGDRKAAVYGPGKAQPLIYSLSLAVYCTSWTFFGSVGLASVRGAEFLAIYIGPILVFTLGNRLLGRMVRLAKAERITSIADFLASRYGKNIAVGALATVIAAVGVLPYVALQLQAIAGAVELVAAYEIPKAYGIHNVVGESALVIAILLAVFAALFGTRHADVTEHQDGIILAVAVESLVKLTAFLAVGAYVTFFMFGSPAAFMDAVLGSPSVQAALSHDTPMATWVMLTFMSGIAILALPRQFHVGIVECRDERDVRTAKWLFPAYLVAINLFVLPIAFAGLAIIGDRQGADLYVLALPMQQGQELLTLAVFVGGLSAATAMVIVACVALSIMISNNLVMPVLISRMDQSGTPYDRDRSRLILIIRRLAIAVIMCAAFFYYRVAKDGTPLAAIGLLSFVAIAQFAPALLGGLMWRRANARGALVGMTAGFAAWFLMLLLPTVMDVPFTDFGSVFPLSLIPWEEANAVLGPDPVTQGAFWSLLINTMGFIAGSLSRRSTPLERVQASVFVPQDVTPIPALKRFRTKVTVGDLRKVVAKYLGEERTRRSFELYEEQEARPLAESDPASSAVVRHAEQLLASAIGSSSSRLVLSLMFQKQDRSARDAFKLLDDASEALQQNRDLLQIALDQMEQGITVMDADFRLTCWNRQFRRLLGLPDHFGRVGVSVGEILHFLAEEGEIASEIGTDTLNRLATFGTPWTTELRKSGRIIEIRSNPMPDGGIVATYTDITAAVKADVELKRANESLEQRVADRTAELMRVNEALALAQTEAEEANIGKTRFLAASGHDILQPLNAARLYCASLMERASEAGPKALAANIDSSLDSVESILGAVLEISRLDTGALRPAVTRFAASEILRQVFTDFVPMAEKRGVRLRFVETSVWLETDRNLFRRLLQNLVSNAIKYTPKGKVLFGFRRRGTMVELQVLDTGIGIPASKQKTVFKEFTRLEDGARVADGHGLGLSIVDRIARVLQIRLSIRSTPAKGTAVSAVLPHVPARRDAEPRQPQQPSLLPGRDGAAGVLALCIDNDARILEGMRMLLEGWGCTVRTHAALAEIGLAAMAEPPDIVFADYHLDEGDGIEAIDAIRKHFGAPVSAYLLTADRSPEVKARALQLGITVINKPVKPAILRAAVNQAAKIPAAAE